MSHVSDFDDGPPHPVVHALGVDEVRDYYNSVKTSHQEALDSHRIQFARFHALPKTAQENPDVPQRARETCFCLTLSDSAAGTYFGGQLLTLGKIVKQAGEQLGRSQLEDCWDTLSIVNEFLEPLKREVKLIRRAVRAHEKHKQITVE